MNKKIRVAILDDHLPIVDGYIYRLEKDPHIEVTATMSYGEELEPTLIKHPADVLLLDVNVPTSNENHNPYPILHAIPRLLQAHPDLNILVISMHAERGLIRAVMDAGASGYILKDDQTVLKELGSVVRTVAGEGIHFSPIAHALYAKHLAGEEILTPRQLEVLSLCAAYPDDSTAELARRLNISNSTLRNLLSSAYLKLEVHNRTGAVAKAQQTGLITPTKTEAPKQ
ncbi:MAG: response regulator transcription factor [Anaerolineales bacterium]|nr:response regulator transcription factor [Anaerolineales bacterium]